ncbi:hypothetical protein BN12_110022 [Nostocoides japonicum T1-X7]|uniref:Uncharacterized protein n=1 Tax=Nostocoides japonicum T1-X7 TaxID=1194083 RepID=A0A077LT56_9MICO|nr:hypothetical protein BN12_110022 [Tetrasphaera japonica T1-X7]
MPSRQPGSSGLLRDVSSECPDRRGCCRACSSLAHSVLSRCPRTERPPLSGCRFGSAPCRSGRGGVDEAQEPPTTPAPSLSSVTASSASHRALVNSETTRQRVHAHALPAGCSQYVHFLVGEACSRPLPWIRRRTDQRVVGPILGLGILERAAARRRDQSVLRVSLARSVAGNTGRDRGVPHPNPPLCVRPRSAAE